MRRLSAEAPPGEAPLAPTGGAPAGWGAPGCAAGDAPLELPGVPAPAPRDGSVARGPLGRPSSPSPMLHIVPGAETMNDSRSSEASLDCEHPARKTNQFSRAVSTRIGRMWKSLMDGPEQTTDIFAVGDTDERHGLARWVTSTGFELTMAFIIFMNTLCIAAEAQYNGMESGYNAGVAPRMTEPADQAWPGAARVFYGLEWFYGVLFTTELALKMVAIPKKTLKDSWTVIDVIVVVFFWVEVLASDLPFPPTLIRLARMARLLRFLRVVKTIRGFASLYLMLQSIKGSVSALGWSSAVLLLGEMMLALALNLLLKDYWEDEFFDLEKRQTLYEYYGTFTKSLLTMVEMLLGNWYSITRILIHFNELFMLFGICHQLILGFAVIEVISGVFLNETFKVANLDDSIMLNEVRRAAKAERIKLTEFFQKADKDGSGLVDQDELKAVLDNKQVGEWLSAMGLDLSDIDRVFAMLDTDGDGQLSCQELVDGASVLKKPARAVDLQAVQQMLQDIRTRLTAKEW